MAESWSVDEVQTFLSLVAEEWIQRELDGATLNEIVFQEVAQLLAAHGYHRNYKQCGDKLRKLKSDYRAIKDHNGRSGASRRTWKWFNQMDSIYGSRPASNGREGALDSATSLLDNTMEDALSPCSDVSTSQLVIAPSPPATSSTSRTPERVVPGKRKRNMHHQEHLAVLREMQVADIQQQELNRVQRERHLQMAIDEAWQAREQEAASRTEERAQTAAFNQAFLNVMRMLVQAMSGRQETNFLPD
ncbi:uncharacterized protein LOC143718456 [Siphateles boraxobius]|uniref:uncharacterized protein LOC143718456 n=1 Tax=Siphateles boraxobius TaxID=180520 RepID=UPI004064128B